MPTPGSSPSDDTATPERSDSDAPPPHASARRESRSAGKAPSINPHLQARPRPAAWSVERYVEGIRAGDRVTLSRAITLVESTQQRHREMAQTVIEACLPYAGDSERIAITGIPGVGKSTFLEALGTALAEDGRKIAVLTVDPSSERSKGSILGDKTRMGALASHPNAYIRPSPTSGSLGGVARKTRETIVLCEAAGFRTLFVETVGVGQSEITVHSMVDVFVLLALAGAGDELQGIKRGIMEMADLIAITKADGDNTRAAEQAGQAYQRALHLFPPTDSGWEPRVLTCSAMTGEGIDTVWDTIQGYLAHIKSNDYFATQRRAQARYWMHQRIEQRLTQDFFEHPAVRTHLGDIEQQVLDGSLTSFAAAERLLQLYLGRE